MAVTLGTAATHVQVQGGFDTTATGTATADIYDAIDARHKEMVAGSKWHKASTSLGTLTSGTAEYAVPSNVVDLEGLMAGTTIYKRISQKQLWQLKAGGSSGGSFFAPDFSSTGAAQIELYPAPASSGAALQGLASLLPVTLSAASDLLIVPDDFAPYVEDGAIATLLRRIKERHDSASEFEGRFTSAIERLRMRQNSRIGSGAKQLSVNGTTYR